ncbi:MAG: hypothetical protein IJA81_00155 [Akkermansia sp.]|nr:hypothetical protein [Akkermansia sp.]
MADNKVDMQIGLGVEYDASGFSAVNADIDRFQQKLDSVKMPAPAPAAAAPQGGGEAVAEAAQAQQQLAEATQTATEATEQQATATAQVDAQLAKEASTLWELAEAKNGSATADAKEQKAMKLATKSRNELIKTLQQLQKELKAAAEAQDVEQYRAVEQEIAETRSAFEKQNQVLELNNIQLGQQAQNGMMVASTLSGMAKGMQEGTISAGDFVSGILSISAAMKAGLGPIGWLMMAVQGLQAAWDYFSAEDKKEEEVRKKRADDMKRLAEITDNARTALEAYNRTELSKKALAAVQGYYTNINTQLERQIKNIERATQAELARLALTQDEEEHKRTMKRAQLGRQLAAGTITQEEYDRAIYDMNEEAIKQGLDADVATAEAELKDAEAKIEEATKAYEEMNVKLSRISKKRSKYGKNLTEGKLKILQDNFEELTEEMEKAGDEWNRLINEDADQELIEAAKDKYYAIMDKRGEAAEAIWGAYEQVHGEGSFASSGYTTDEAIAAMVADRKDLDEQHKVAIDEMNAHRKASDPLYEARRTAKQKLQTSKDTRTRELGQLAEEREEEEKGRALQKLLDEKQKAATELAKLETAELKRRSKDAKERAKAARAAGDAEGAAVLENLATLYKDEVAQRSKAVKNKAAVDAARKKTEQAAPTQDKRTDEVLREAEQLANRIAKGEALDGRSVEQLLALFEQAKATKDKKDDAFVAQLIQLMQMQADVGVRLQGEVRRLKRKTEKLTSRNFD